ncbi:hypothetical protein Cpir12675_004547 [Ceratocystis pirilliformis]|uniref:Uncharacterized protein n=1 Tax=Ceratocystis pirilliformis TaxID=259994 RepID=A0ABR3YVM4_9PEZI
MGYNYNRCCQCNTILAISDTCSLCHHEGCTECLSTPLPGSTLNYFDYASLTPRHIPSPPTVGAPLSREILSHRLSVKKSAERRERELREKAFREKERRDREVAMRRAENAAKAVLQEN